MPPLAAFTRKDWKLDLTNLECDSTGLNKKVTVLGTNVVCRRARCTIEEGLLYFKRLYHNFAFGEKKESSPRRWK